MKPLPLVNGALFVSSSFLDTLICPRSSEYYKLHARVLDAKGAGLLFGTHLHSALSLYYRLQEFDLSKDEVLKRVAQLLESKFATEPNDEGDWRNLNWAMEVFQQHMKKFEFEDYQVMRYSVPQKCKYCDGKGLEPIAGIADCDWCNGTGHHTIMSEVPFVVKLFDYDCGPLCRDFWQNQPNWLRIHDNNWRIPVYFHGFIDLLTYLKYLLFILDFKSTSKLGQSYWDDKKAIGQPKGYAWAVEQLLGLKVHGYIIRALRTIEPPLYVTNKTANKKGEFKKIEDWWDESIVEQRFDLGEGELEEWRTNTIHQVEQFLWHYEKGFFPQNKKVCVGTYGRCQYYDVCSTFPVGDRERLLNSELFKDKETNIQLIK